jgi:hypothetical protein
MINDILKILLATMTTFARQKSKETINSVLLTNICNIVEILYEIKENKQSLPLVIYVQLAVVAKMNFESDNKNFANLFSRISSYFPNINQDDAKYAEGKDKVSH